METNSVLVESPAHAPTMGSLGKVRYTHLDMMDYIIGHPEVSQKELAARYGYSQSWVCNIMASDVWQAKFAERRELMVDPELRATVDERMRAIVIRSQQVLMEKLDKANVADSTVLKALELGAKGINAGGQNATPGNAVDHLANLANRLISLQANIRKGVTLEATEVDAEPEVG